MSLTTLSNPVTRDVVTLFHPLPASSADDLVFTTLLPPGSAGSPAHRHARVTERFEVLDGQVTFRIGHKTARPGVGDCLVVRPNTVHAFSNTSDQPAVLKCTVSPGRAFEEFLRGMHGAAVAGQTGPAGLPRDPRRLARLLIAADFHFPRVPMALQRILFRALAALGTPLFRHDRSSNPARKLT
jgi:mannose-6-phosphate isomerase-like protein (cupin superfamily)